MRVVGGSARGRRLRSPAGRTVRPTSDRAREAIFNSLGSLGLVEDSTVLDLFAGTGAMGIEALSRGAAAATFVEHDRLVAGIIRENLAAVGFEGEIVVADAVGYVSRAGHFDVAFADPPYEFDQWDRLLAHLDAGTVVLESDRELLVGEEWQVIRVKRYGGTVVTLAQAQAPKPS
jgi:16S rRNA (guanine966-N2)-methyltransferase